MKKIFFTCFFLSYVFGSDFDITLDNFTNSFSKVKANYLKYNNDRSYSDQFIRSHNHLTEFLKETFETKADELFQRTEQRNNLYLAHAVIETVESIVSDRDSFNIWKIKDIDIVFNLFKRANNLMKIMVKRKDWANSKIILKSLLLIQKRFLPLLWYQRLAQKRMDKYKFIYDNFDPDDKDAFLDLFHHLSSLALNHRGEVPENSLLAKLIKLFKVYRYHFLSFDRERYGKISTIPRKFLYSIVVAKVVTKLELIDILKNGGSLSPLLKLNCLKKAFKFYSEQSQSNEVYDCFKVEFSLKFIVFIRESIDSGKNTFNLKESDQWLLKAIIQLITKSNIF
jgi:hypothetical protein